MSFEYVDDFEDIAAIAEENHMTFEGDAAEASP